MTLRRALRTVALVPVLLAAAPGAAAVRPNVVLVVVDDVARADVARLDRLQEMLFRAGTELRSFLIPDALCGPSRVSILRGQHGHNTGITTNRRVSATVRALGLESSTLATWLADAGYATALFGKYLNAYGRGSDPLARTYVPPGWTEWYGGVPGRGYGFWLNHNGSVVTYPADGPHPNDVLAGLAASFIARHADQPMFLYVAPGSSHGDAPPAHRHQDAFPDAELPQGPSFNEEDVSDKPAWIGRLVPQPADQTGRLERHRNRLRAMLSVEDLLATVLRALADRGVLDSTYVIFVSDNGYHYGEHRIRASKATAYDEALLVPAVIRGPGVPAGVAIDHLATNADLAVTIADLAGVAVPSFVDGRSLVPLLRGDRPEPRAWRRAIGIEHLDRRLKGDGPSPSFYGVLLDRWKYVRHPETGEQELYDRIADPFELNSLHSTGDAVCLRVLRDWADALADCIADECRALEQNRRRARRASSCREHALLAADDDVAALFDTAPVSTLPFEETACARPMSEGRPAGPS